MTVDRVDAELQAHAVHFLAGRLVTTHRVPWHVAADTVLAAAALPWRMPTDPADLAPFGPAAPTPNRAQRRQAARRRRSR